MRDIILIGDVRAKLAEIPAGSVHCVVTSPPYWALRDYGVEGQLGSEATPEEYLANQIEVFRGVWRALRDDGDRSASRGTKGKTMSSEKTAMSAPVHAVVITPLEEPIVIDAIRCRLRQDIDDFGVRHSIPTEELRLILDIIDAARHCVREWKPNTTEKARGAGTGVGMRAAEDKLILVLKGDLRRS